jgi:hypothetical protein
MVKEVQISGAVGGQKGSAEAGSAEMALCAYLLSEALLTARLLLA